jgi:hypothetical protein
MDPTINIEMLKDMFNIEKIRVTTGEHIIYDDHVDIINILLFGNYNDILEYIDDDDDDDIDTSIFITKILHGDFDIKLDSQLRTITGERSTITTNILTVMALCNFNPGTIVNVMDKHHIMPDTYTYIFVTLFHPYETMVHIGDRYFSSIEYVKEYNSDKYRIMRENMIDYVSHIFPKLIYILKHDQLIIKIFDEKDELKYSQYRKQIYRPSIYTREYHYNKNINLFYDGIRSIILNNDFGEITSTLKNINNIELKNIKTLHKCIQNYIIQENRWDIIVSDSYSGEYILEYGNFDIGGV